MLVVSLEFDIMVERFLGERTLSLLLLHERMIFLCHLPETVFVMNVVNNSGSRTIRSSKNDWSVLSRSPS
jgi:hypothetical protein